MTNGNLIIVGNNLTCVMSEIPYDMFPWSLGKNIILQYLSKGISSLTQAKLLYKSILGKEYYEDEDRFNNYHQMKTLKENDDFWLISDYLYVVNNSDMDVSFTNKMFGSFVAEKGKLTIAHSYKRIQVVAPTKTFDLQLEDKEICLLENALDFYVRLHLGQYDHIAFDLRSYCDENYPSNNIIEPLLCLIRNRIIPDFDDNNLHQYYGIASEDVNINGRLAYEVLKTIMHNRAYTEHPEGGNTVDFNTPLEVSGKPLPDNESKVVNGKVVSKTNVKKYHLQPIIQALDVFRDYLSIDFVRLFSHFTTDKYALMLAKVLGLYYTEEMQPRISVKRKEYDALIDKVSYQLLGIEKEK